MSSLRTAGEFLFTESTQLSVAFARALVQGRSLAETLELILPEIRQAFRASRIFLVDYREYSDRFVLLHYDGYPSPDARYQLQRRMNQIDLRKALTVRTPYVPEDDPTLLILPLYFRNILEALVALQFDEPILLDEQGRESAEVVSKMIGLLMSSTRLKVNRDQIVDMHDLRQARQLQLSFLPRDKTPNSEICDVYGYNNSSALVGGDYFDYFSQRPGSIQGVLADACGHGLSAALIASTFRGLLQSEINRRQEFEGLFDDLNKSVHSGGEYLPYLTCVFFDYKAEDRSLTYLNAGHYEPLVVGRDESIRTLPGGGPPLGMFKNSNYSLRSATLTPGDLVVLFTDGLIDMQDEQENYFGVEGVAETVLKNGQLELPQLSKEVLTSARRFSQGRMIEDDVTLFLFRVR